MTVALTGGVAGRRALVTGATSGAGAAIADKLEREDAEVWIVARRPPAGHPARQRFTTADLTTAEGTAAVAERMAGVGGADILVHVSTGSPRPVRAPGSTPSGS